MRDLNELLEQEGSTVDLGPDAFGDLLRRREVVHRRQRVTAALTVVLLIGCLTVAMLAAIRQQQSKPATPDLDVGTVSGLQELWNYDVGGVLAPPAAGDGIVVTVSRSGEVLAFAPRCRTDGRPCDPMWTAEVGPMRTMIDPIGDIGVPTWPGHAGLPNGPEQWGGATIADGAVYTINRDGTLFAFAATCATDGSSCSPMWRARVHGDASLPQVMNQAVYVATSATVSAFRGCASDGSFCEPTWRVPGDTFLRAQDGALYLTDRTTGLASELDPETGETIWFGGPGSDDHGACGSNTATPVRLGDTVYVDCGAQLFAFPADCQGQCAPTWVGDIPDPFSSGPVVAGGGVALTVATDQSTGGILSFPVDCTTGGATCTTVHRTDVDSELTTVSPVVNGDVLIASSTRAGSVFAFDPACLAAQNACPTLWTAPVLTPDEPVTSAGIAFVAELGTGPLRAFPVACQPQAVPSGQGDSRRCLPLWESGFVSAGLPAVSDNVVYTSDANGVVHASGLVAAEPGQDTRASQGRPEAPFALLVGVGIVGILAARALLRRRRARW